MTIEFESTSGKFPYFIKGHVVKGFGRGSKQLGCPTANLESDIVDTVQLTNGIYYGFAQLENESPDEKERPPVYLMCCSLGYNPQFKNTKKSLEVHILNQFPEDFYGAKLRVAICGHIRPEWKFNSLDELIAAINSDIAHTKKVLEEEKQFSEIPNSEFFL
ncbi:Riboflavin kinase [Halotydeus destructor]|nr:Riboflavin kinase [Halotydeus destructor]